MGVVTIPRPATPIQDLSGFGSPIGGIAAVGDGGYMLIRPTDIPYTNYTLLDVIRWRIASGFGEQPIAKSGMLGATASRRTGHSYVWEAEVVTDLRIQAELPLRESNSGGFIWTPPGSRLAAEIYFRLGTPVCPAPATVQPRYYWLPRGKIDSFSPMVDAGDKRRVRYKLAGCANCHCLLLPEQGDPLDGGVTTAGAYAQYLANFPDA
jgi:hypothetical protein